MKKVLVKERMGSGENLYHRSRGNWINKMSSIRNRFLIIEPRFQEKRCEKNIPVLDTYIVGLCFTLFTVSAPSTRRREHEMNDRNQ